MNRFYYVNQQQETGGPVEEAWFYEALHGGLLSPETPVTPEEAEDWEPLAAVLPYYFTFGTETRGPAPLAKLRPIAAASGEEMMVIEPGGAAWRALSSLCPHHVPPAAAVSPAAPVPAHNPYAPPAAAVALPRGKRPSFPGGVRAAGVTWVLYGAARLAYSCVLLMTGAAAPALSGFVLVASMIPIVVGLTFLTVGMQAFRGTLTKLKSNALGSIGIGLLLLGYSVFLNLEAKTGSGTLLLEGGINATLIIAGILAFCDRAKFLAWQQFGASGPRKVPQE